MGSFWYDSELGRFVTEDPIKHGLNWYIYASNNPLIRIDPTGLADYIHGTSPPKEVPCNTSSSQPGKVIQFPKKSPQTQNNPGIEMGYYGLVVGLLQGYLLHTRDFWNEKGALKDSREDGSFDEVTPLQIKTWQAMNERGENAYKIALPPGFVERYGRAWSPDTGDVTYGEAWDIVSSRMNSKGTSKTGQGFNTFNDAKKALGSPGEGKCWHHIVEQSQIQNQVLTQLRFIILTILFQLTKLHMRR